MCSDLKVNITLIADRAMQTEALGGLASISKDLRATRYFSTLFLKSCAFTLRWGNVPLFICPRAFASARGSVLLLGGPCSLAFLWLNTFID